MGTTRLDTIARAQPRMQRSFPQDFVFGAATAAFQIEGAAHEDGRRDSVWDAFARIPGAVIDGDNGDVACEHYHRYRDDVALMKTLGLQSYRFSTSWARVRPDGGALNPKGIDFYRRLVDELLDAGIMPWLTLYHWNLPQRLQDAGGWTVRDTADRFTEYALDMHDALGDRVGVWTTLNEPWCASFLSHTAGVHAPGHYSAAEGMLAAHHLLLGHGQVVRALRDRDPGLNLGITLNQTLPDPADPTDPADADAARRIDGQFNRWFLDPLFRAEYPADILADFARVAPEARSALDAAILPGDLETIATPIDTLGVNYYQGELVSGRPTDRPAPGGEARTGRRAESPFPAAEGIHWVERNLPHTSMGWDIQPEGLTRVLLRLHEEYSQPAGTRLFVTENGAAFDDEVTTDDGAERVPDRERTAYLRAHLGAVLDALAEGADVGGYFYWSLLDNYEWAWGYAKRFGIVRVDYASQRRTIKDSGIEYSRIIEARALDLLSESGENSRQG